MRAKAILICAMALAGCNQTTGSARLPQAAIPSDYRPLVVSYLRGTLKDPYSVRSAEISGPTSGFVGIMNGGVMPLVCTRFNSKNSYGAYTGLEAVAVIFINGRPVHAVPGAAACSDAQYSPFPELEKIG